jgi:hypothetical protein
MKSLLNRLLINQRIGPISLIYAKELQQYAEEVVFLARKCAHDPTPRYNFLVESMLKSAEAREVLYEHLVPRYGEVAAVRGSGVQGSQLVTRVVNAWTFRERDTTPTGFIEFVDRPGELMPTPKPISVTVEERGDDFSLTRKQRRRLSSQQ